MLVAKKKMFLLLFIYSSTFSYGQTIDSNMIKYEVTTWRKKKEIRGYANLFKEEYKRKKEEVEFLEVHDSIFTYYEWCNSLYNQDSCRNIYRYKIFKIRDSIFIKYEESGVSKTDLIFSLSTSDTVYSNGNFSYYNSRNRLGTKWFFYGIKKKKIMGKDIDCYLFKSIGYIEFEKIKYETFCWIDINSLLPIETKQYFVRSKFRRIAYRAIISKFE